MSLRELLATYLPPPPEPPGLVELLALTNDLKSDWNRIMAAARYDEDKKRRWQALRDRANPPWCVEWPLAPPDEMVQLRRAQAATGKLINEYEAEKATREDYILELRAKLKRAGDECGLYARAFAGEVRYRREIETKSVAKLYEQIERERVAANAAHGVTRQQLAIAQANAQSLERGLPAAVDAATAQLRAELAECRKYVCEVICDRDAAKKERDEAVASAERTESTRRHLQDANEALRAAFNNACADRDAAKELLTQAQRQLMANRLPGAVLEENENLRRLSSEACAERENLRGELVEAKDRLAESQRARQDALTKENALRSAMSQQGHQLRAVDEWLSNWERGVTRARDVVKELCRLRGIRT